MSASVLGGGVVVLVVVVESARSTDAPYDPVLMTGRAGGRMHARVNGASVFGEFITTFTTTTTAAATATRS